MEEMVEMGQMEVVLDVLVAEAADRVILMDL